MVNVSGQFGAHLDSWFASKPIESSFRLDHNLHRNWSNQVSDWNLICVGTDRIKLQIGPRFASSFRWECDLHGSDPIDRSAICQEFLLHHIGGMLIDSGKRKCLLFLFSYFAIVVVAAVVVHLILLSPSIKNTRFCANKILLRLSYATDSFLTSLWVWTI
jgi:hypothetical protein